jgi:hypothetical protein
MFVLISLLLYVIMRTFMGGDPVIGYTHIIFFIEIFFIPLFLVTYTHKAGIRDNKKYFRLILVLGGFASVLSAVSFIVPSIGNLMRYEIMDTKSDSILYTDSYRGFGLASGLTYAFGIIQGSMIALSAFHIRDNRWFILFYPLVIVSILLNARTGIVVAFVGIMIYLFVNIKIKSLLNISFAILFTYMIIIQALSTFSISTETIWWIEDFFEQFISVRMEKSLNATYTMDSLFNRMWVWPNGHGEWIFGKGLIIFGQNDASNSDIGYIQQLNYGGLVYTFILGVFLIKVIKRMMKNNIDITQVLFFIGVFIVANLKGNYLINSGSFRFMMYIYYFTIYTQYTHNIQTNNAIAGHYDHPDEY